MPQGQEALVWLFRAMSRADLDDIIDFGGFRQKPDRLSYEGKLFATNVEDASIFGRINYRLEMLPLVNQHATIREILAIPWNNG